MDTSMAMQPANFLDGLRTLVTPGVVSTATNALGESEATVTKGLGAALSTIVGTLASKADDQSFMSRMFDMIKDPASESSSLAALTMGDTSSSSLSSRFMSTLFGDKTNSIVQALSSFTGITQSKASSLLSLAGPLALSYLGRTVRTRGLDLAGLCSMLLTQRNAIIRIVPSTLSSVLGMGSQFANTTYRTVDTAVRTATPWRWALPVLLILLALAGLAWMLIGSRS